MIDHRLGDLEADLHGGVEGAHRVLEDHPDLFSADVAHLFFWKLEQVNVIKENAALFNLCGGGKELEQSLRRDRFPTPRFAYDGERFSLLEREGDVAYDAHF